MTSLAISLTSFDMFDFSVFLKAMLKTPNLVRSISTSKDVLYNVDSTYEGVIQGVIEITSSQIFLHLFVWAV
ncbi:hypothetical protein QQP08_024628 [Theobroma cacao]|nr:hypothetical protein QQP08_024628 [Theobroma cacao]